MIAIDKHEFERENPFQLNPLQSIDESPDLEDDLADFPDDLSDFELDIRQEAKKPAGGTGDRSGQSPSQPPNNDSSDTRD